MFPKRAAGRCSDSDTAPPELISYSVRKATSSALGSQGQEDIIDFPKRSVRIYTCGKLYETWKAERRYWSIPKGDIPFDITYIDTKAASIVSSQDLPIVVALHGIIGSIETFAHLASHLGLKGARVIVPEFPGLSTHKLTDFRHTPEERAQLMQDFLRKLELPRVDMLVCHSASFFVGLIMCWKNESPKIRSLVLLNPPSFKFPKMMKPSLPLKLLLELYRFPVVKLITIVTLKTCAIFRKQLRKMNIMDIIFIGTIMIGCDRSKGRIQFQELLRTDFPVLLAFSEDDKIIPKKQMYNVASKMTSSKEISRYDKSGGLEDRGTRHSPRKVIAFENGTHYLTSKYPKIISEEITNFLFDTVLQKDESPSLDC